MKWIKIDHVLLLMIIITVRELSIVLVNIERLVRSTNQRKYRCYIRYHNLFIITKLTLFSLPLFGKMV